MDWQATGFWATLISLFEKPTRYCECEHRRALGLRQPQHPRTTRLHGNVGMIGSSLVSVIFRDRGTSDMLLRTLRQADWRPMA